MANKNYQVTALYSEAVQVGMEEWKQMYTSRTFGPDSTIRDIIDWIATMQSHGPININSVTFAAHTGGDDE
jgi:hypothetical protein